MRNKRGKFNYTNHEATRDKVRLTLIAVRVTHAEDDWVTQQADILGISRPDVCREALREYMAGVERAKRAEERRLQDIQSEQEREQVAKTAKAAIEGESDASTRNRD